MARAVFLDRYAALRDGLAARLTSVPSVGTGNPRADAKRHDDMLNSLADAVDSVDERIGGGGVIRPVTQTQYNALPKPTPDGVYYDIIEPVAAPPGPTVTDLYADVRARVTAGDLSDYGVFGPANSGTIAKDGSNVSFTTGAGVGVGSGYGFTVPVLGNDLVSASISLRAQNTGWGRSRVSIDWLGSDKTTVLSTLNGVEGSTDAFVNSIRTVDGVNAPTAARFARVRTDLRSTNPATTPVKMVLVDVVFNVTRQAA